jgi:hypothetical protein
MGLKPTLTLNDTETFSDTINFSITDDLTVTAPAKSLSLEIATNTGGNHIIVPESTNISYLFVRHTGTTDGSTSTSQLVDIEDTDNVAIARLGPGEFCFLPWHKAGATKGVQLQVAHASNVQMEYAYWTKG